MSHDYRPSSGAYTRPESPRRPTPILDPLPPRPPSASSSRLNTPRAPSPSPPSPNRLPALNHSMASLNSPPSVDMTEQMGNWLQTNMPPALQASLNNWCNAHAQPLLSGFLEQWMALNSQQLLQQELSRHLVPMQQALQQQQHMIGELQQTVTSQAAHIATLEASLAGVKKQVDAIPPPSAAPAATAAAASEPTPFTPTLPFQVGGSPVQPIHHPATSAIQSSQSLSPSATMGLGPRGVRPPSASSSRAVAFRDHEDGVGQSIDPKEKLRQSMTNGLARGLLGSVTAAGPGETYAGSEPQTRGAIRVHGSGARSKATGPIDIIVVDDLELARKIAHATLTKSHFKVELAADGLQAIELYKQYMGTGLKAVLMDIHLPGISGIETTERIRKIEQEAGIPPALIYGLTGDVGEDDLAKYKACGMNGCILKGKLLADAVKTAIEESSNGVQFVNLCDRQNGSSSSSSSAAAASSNASSASSTPPTSSGSQSSTISNLPHASPAERLRAEASGSPPGVFGTPRAPQPRAILMDKHGGARGSVKPGIGLGRDASSSGNSPTMSTQDRIMMTPSTNGPDLLLVEDVRVSRQIAMKSLKKMGFNVVEAESGEQAVDKFKQHTQTLKYIIMDINLPGISGIEATESIRSFEKSSGGGVDGGVIILGLTGNVDAESMHNYEVAGMNGCILKGNVLTNVLQQAIKEAQEGKFVNIS